MAESSRTKYTSTSLWEKSWQATQEQKEATSWITCSYCGIEGHNRGGCKLRKARIRPEQYPESNPNVEHDQGGGSTDGYEEPITSQVCQTNYHVSSICNSYTTFMSHKLAGFHAVWRGEPTTTITNDRNFVFSTVCRCKSSQTWSTFSNWNEHHLTCCHAVFTNKQKATSEGTIARLHIHQHQPANCKASAPYYFNQGRKSKVKA